MYCFSNKNSINELRDQLKHLVTAVPLHKGQENTATDIHHWHDMAEKLLKERDEELAVALTNQLISASEYGLNHGDIWSYTKPLMLTLMREYGDVIWPIFGEAIIRAKGMNKYWLQQLFDRETSLVGNVPSVLSVIPVESVMEWCFKQPDLGPVFVARCLNVIETVDEVQQPSLRLLPINSKPLSTTNVPILPSQTQSFSNSISISCIYFLLFIALRSVLLTDR